MCALHAQRFTRWCIDFDERDFTDLIIFGDWDKHACFDHHVHVSAVCENGDGQRKEHSRGEATGSVSDRDGGAEATRRKVWRRLYACSQL